jgi:hypothetical protein
LHLPAEWDNYSFTPAAPPNTLLASSLTLAANFTAIAIAVR